MGRTPGPTDVTIDYARCSACGRCSEVCKAGPLYREQGRLQIDPSRFFGCIACGQCMAVCPLDCITVTGRDLSPADRIALPPKGQAAHFEALQALMRARRSHRQYLDKAVPREMIDRLLEAAQTAPMGIPPSEVGVLVLADHGKVRDFKNDLLGSARSMKRFMSPLVLALLRPFMGRESHTLMKSFVLPVLDTYLKLDAEGRDWFFYDAPLALFFYGSPWADPADATIAATYAMLAGESLGLGSCMLGFPGPLLKHNRTLKDKYGLPARMQAGLAVVFGYPAHSYRHALNRRFADIRFA